MPASFTAACMPSKTLAIKPSAEVVLLAVWLAHPSLRSLVPQDLKKQGALGPVVSSDALVFPGEHLQVWRRAFRRCILL